MNEICGDNRFEIIAKAKAHLLEATNIDTSEDEMKVLDTFLFRCWQMGWLDRYDTADRKTEPRGDDIIVRSNLEQFRVGLEYHTDTTHFGKVKGESITTNKVEDEPQYSEDDMYWLSLAEDVANGKMSDAGANQAWLEYINHKDEPTISKTESVEDEPQTEREGE